MESEKILDAKGLSCPMPVVKAKKAIDDLQSGDILEVHVTDKEAKNDMPAWAKASGHQLVKQTEEGNILKFWIKKG
ncbi:sulfurtransferase TusA family protein [Heyndrickxia coagulans]|uniref:TusA-related sulfurtransferase n=1 Tax=Heyndrickxia coagulans DSM 1 = ATCC 7050 TaxID=1121088 RepID=A0A8B4BYV9_HEYCO|nr:sulfurtransferase TusA family protein [Heyndrickxia coagulans]AJH77414.1 sulfurtransferase TusA family protein [Heyndrickxia coagulans DSM 1 = ATCC 7050]MCR2847574.1 sulfurtransferase TusA family protein [Heyndrickxia coagulans]MDR4225383.1 sulfurtransferase TusA family protein [Heyndrickxia coagulans DSM 1 = ATCC 7050]MED4346388.1 sulfurtransferase TusA family protein [Heyndrickxia coagulans]MED4405263.1 sulfurtransferase TusA family protein [Heyndrickxia coagulans]